MSNTKEVTRLTIEDIDVYRHQQVLLRNQLIILRNQLRDSTNLRDHNLVLMLDSLFIHSMDITSDLINIWDNLKNGK